MNDALGRPTAGIPADLEITGVVLSYHRIASAQFDPWGLRVTPQMFEQQLSVLRDIGDPMPLSEFVACRSTRHSLRPAVVITFDDGYVDNLTALPLLEAFEAPATIFVCTGYTGKPYFWWEALEHVFLRPNRLPQYLDLQYGGTVISWILADAAHYTAEQYAADCRSCRWRGEPGTRVRLYHDVYEALWPLAHDVRLGLVSDIVAWAGLSASSFTDARPMTGTELVAIGAEALITIGGHSVNHLPLDQMPSSVQAYEIAGGQQALQEILGRPVDAFAYPHGKYTDKTIAILEEHEFVSACTTRQRCVRRSEPAMALPRLTIKNWGRDEFKARIAQFLSEPQV